jgi:hypothetical protein
MEQYGIKNGAQVITVDPAQVVLDGERIFSPRTVVDTPFGVGEIVGLDPHLGCYAVKNVHGGYEDPTLTTHKSKSPAAYVQIRHVVKHVEHVASDDVVVEDGLVSTL